MEYIKKINIDINRKILDTVPAVQLDTARALQFYIHEGGNNYSLTGKTVKVYGVKPDGTKIFANATIINATQGICKLKLTNNMLAIAGDLKLMLTIMEGNDILSTIPFVLKVIETLRDDGAVESTDEFTALEEALDLVNQWNNYFEETSGHIEELYTHRLNDIEKGVRRLKWLSASNTLTNGMYPSEDILNHLAYQRIDQTLIVMVKIVDKYDTNPQTMDDSRVITAIDNATAKGIKTVMLKPHLGINWSDGTERYNLVPSDMEVFMNNWKAILLNYASICNTKGVPVLCIGCEQRNMTKESNKALWQDLVDTIKGEYPNLILTYACDNVEGVQYDTSSIYTLNGLDYIGLNLYPQWYKKPSANGITYRDIIPAIYHSYAPTKDGFHYVSRAEYIYEKYGKKTYITETGVMPFDDGLVTLKSQHATDTEAPRNYTVPALCYEAVLNTYPKCKYIDGISFWGSKFPFCYFDETALAGESPAEEVIKKYIDGGDIVE